MNSPIFLITDYINNFTSLEQLRIELFKKHILTKDYVEDGLFLIYHKFDQSSKTDIERECRSIILDRETKQIISYSCDTPLTNADAMEHMLLNPQADKLITRCYEGTLLSVFTHNNKWYVSTRRCLNSDESVWGVDKTSHYTMFMDVLRSSGYDNFDSFTDKLDNNKCYYFILIHYQNRNIVDYSNEFGQEYKKLCLAFVREKSTQNEMNLYDGTTDISNIVDNNIFVSEKLNSLEEFDNLNKTDIYMIPPKTEGVVVKVYDSKVNRNILLKLQTINYQFAKSTGTDKNIFIGLIHLYQKDKLVDYLSETNNNLKKIVNPLNLQESYDTVGIIDALFKVCTSELFELFKLLWNIKTGKQLNDTIYKLLPKEYKDILFGIRGLYFKKKSDFILNNKVNFLQIKDIYQFMKTIPTEQFCALLKMRKLMYNWAKVNIELGDFNKISIKCDKVHFKLAAIYCNKLFPNIMPDEIPPVNIEVNHTNVV
jgi:hypothetical protein